MIQAAARRGRVEADQRLLLALLLLRQLAQRVRLLLLLLLLIHDGPLQRPPPVGDDLFAEERAERLDVLQGWGEEEAGRGRGGRGWRGGGARGEGDCCWGGWRRWLLGGHVGRRRHNTPDPVGRGGRGALQG